MERVSYGPDPEQYAEWSPVPGARGIVVVVHGGYWRARYDLSLGRPLAAALNHRGWSTLNLEYRRVGNGGGVPATFDDVAAGIDLLASLAPGYADPIVALGHSAGGHLAVWAAARSRFGWPERVKLTQVVSQAGVLDLRAAQRDRLSSDAVSELISTPLTASPRPAPAPDGAPPAEPDQEPQLDAQGRSASTPGPAHEPESSPDVAPVIDARYDPMQQLPLDVPVTCLHAIDDDAVPVTQSLDYVAASRAAAAAAAAEAGDAAGTQAPAVPATYLEVTGGHFGLIDPESDAWAAVITVLNQMSSR